jgi:hypothetical protein
VDIHGTVSPKSQLQKLLAFAKHSSTLNPKKRRAELLSPKDAGIQIYSRYAPVSALKWAAQYRVDYSGFAQHDTIRLLVPCSTVQYHSTYGAIVRYGTIVRTLR